VLIDLAREDARLVGLKLGVPQSGLHDLPKLTLQSSEPLTGRIGKPRPKDWLSSSGQPV